jgi:hypothetical protein
MLRPITVLKGPKKSRKEVEMGRKNVDILFVGKPLPFVEVAHICTDI